MGNPKKRAEKQEAAGVRKVDAETAAKSKQEEESWSKGAKGASKADQEAERKAEAARKKAEKKALEEEEAKSLPEKAVKPVKGADKAAQKKTNKVDDFLADSGIEKKAPGLAASNIEDALDVLSISGKQKAATDIDRHPERRFKAAYTAYEERRIAEMKAEKSGLRLQQMKDQCYKEFQKSPENPFNQATAAHNATREELAELADVEKKKTEARLLSK